MNQQTTLIEQVIQAAYERHGINLEPDDFHTDQNGKLRITYHCPTDAPPEGMSVLQWLGWQDLAPYLGGEPWSSHA